jgi:hypothetical protein
VEKDVLIKKIQNSFCRITGDDTVPSDTGNEIYKLLLGKCDDVIDAVLNRAPRIYSGNTRIPPESFWWGVIASEQRTYDIRTGRVRVTVEKPSEDERKRVASIAAEISAKFEKMSPQYVKKVSPVMERRKRMAEQARMGNVMIESFGEYEGQWMNKEKAVSLGLIFLDPMHEITGRRSVERW